MSENPETTEILGVRIACLDLQGLFAVFRAQIGRPAGLPPFRLGYANTYVLNLAQSDPAYRAILNRLDLVYADGIGAVIAARILRGCRLVKLTGADWIDMLFGMLEAHRLRVFILAGKPGVAERAGAHFKQKFPDVELVGTADGYFSRETSEQVIDRIRAASPDVLFVGMGTRRQEHWIETHIDRLPVRICWAVGALFDYAAGEVRRAPGWMLAMQLEWLWRLVVDPIGTWRRYILGTPVFLWRVLGARVGLRRGRRLSGR